MSVIISAAEDALENHRRLLQASRKQRISLARQLFSASSGGSCWLGDFVVDSAYGPRFSSGCYDEEGNVLTIRTTDFTSNGLLSFSTAPAVRLELRVVAAHRLTDGDFLLSRSGEYAGMVRVFDEAFAPRRAFIPAAFIIRFRLDKTRLLPWYLFEYCESPQGEALVRGLSRGSAQPNISGTSFLQLRLPVPGMTEQEDVCRLLRAARQAETVSSCRKDKCATLRNIMINNFLDDQGVEP